MIRSLVVWSCLTLVTCSGGACQSTETKAARFSFNWSDWRESRAFGLGDSLYLARLQNNTISLVVIVDGEPQRLMTAKSSLENGTIPVVTSDRDKALYMVTTTRGGGPTQVFRYDVASKDFEQYWAGKISGVIIEAHFLPDPNVLIIVTQNFCYLVDASGSITDFGPAIHDEAPWYFAASAASSRALALNLNGGLTVYEPGEESQIVEQRGRHDSVQEMASIGDDWIVLHLGSGPDRLLQVGPEKIQKIAAPPKRYLRVRSYGDVAVLWSHDSSELLFIGSEGTRQVDVNLGEFQEEDLNWSLLKGYSGHSVFLVDGAGYWTVRIPQLPAP